jgi:hypothetical protein
VTASNPAEASVDAARTPTDEELGAKVRKFQARLSEKVELIEALGRRINALESERFEAHNEVRALRTELNAMIYAGGTGGTYFATGGIVYDRPEAFVKAAAWMPE